MCGNWIDKVETYFFNILVKPKICLYLISRQVILFIYFFIDKAKTTPTHRFKIGVIKIVGHTRALEYVAVMWWTQPILGLVQLLHKLLLFAVLLALFWAVFEGPWQQVQRCWSARNFWARRIGSESEGKGRIFFIYITITMWLK